MTAKSLSIAQLLQGPKQFYIPVFQRNYEWLSLEKDAGGQVSELWADIASICLRGKKHFIGPIVTKKIHSNTGHLLPRSMVIDGQQRLITLITMLCVIRSYAEQLENVALAEKIVRDYLLNHSAQSRRRLRIIASNTNRDREVLSAIIYKEKLAPELVEHPIYSSFQAFQTFIQRYLYTTQPEQQAKALDILLHQILDNLSAVEIQLGEDDNPALIFQSLNSKGRDLSHSDLCRSYIFMQLSSEPLQKRLHEFYWEPIEKRLLQSSPGNQEGVIDGFLKNYLATQNPHLRERDIYHTLEERVGGTDFEIETFLVHLSEFSSYYQILLKPAEESNVAIYQQVQWLNNIGLTGMTPTMLNLFHHARTQQPLDKKYKLKEKELLFLLQLVESLVIRRSICQLSNTRINHILSKIYQQALDNAEQMNLYEGFVEACHCDYFPDDASVLTALSSKDFKTTGMQARRVLNILLRMECHLSTASVSAKRLNQPYSLEHVMPYSLTHWWRKELGDDFLKIHQKYLHNLGNITLVPYQGALSNRKFPEKKILLKETSYALNQYFDSSKKWKAAQIQDRTKVLSKLAVAIWKHPYMYKRGEEVGSLKGERK